MINDLFVGFNNLLTFKDDNQGVLSEFRAPFQISFFLTILFIFSLIYSFYLKHQKYKFLLISLVIPSILIYITLGGIMQYIFSSLGIFSILSSISILNLLDKIKNNLKILSVIFLILFFIISPLSRSYYYLTNFKYDNRLLSASWINENIDKGSKISVLYPPTNWNSVPFNFKNYTILDQKNILNADYVILVNQNIDTKFSDQFTLVKEFSPKSVFGYTPSLKGEVLAIYAKYINIYKKN